MKRDSQLSKTFKNDKKWYNSTHTHPNPASLTENSMPRPGEASGTSPGPEKYKKICRICLFGPFLALSASMLCGKNPDGSPRKGRCFTSKMLTNPHHRCVYSDSYIKTTKSRISIDFFDFFEGPGPGVWGPFGRMGNVNWVILGFRPEKCTQFFSDPEPPISDLTIGFPK